MTAGGYDFLEYRISMVTLLAFLLLFLPLKYGKWRSGIIAIVSFAVTTALDAIQFLTPFSQQYSVVITLIQIVIVQATAFILCKYRDFRALFTGVTSSAFVMIGNIIGWIMELISKNVFVGISVQVFLHIGLLWLIAVRLRAPFHSEMARRKNGWGTLCFIPALCYAVVYALASWPSNITDSPGNMFAAVLMLVLMTITYILIIRLLSQQRIDAELQRSNEFLETYAEGLRRQAEMVRRADEEMSVVRHDIRHIYSLMSSYLDAGETEKVRELLKRQNAELDKVKAKRYCENIAVNGILGAIDQQALKLNVEFECKADVPEKLGRANEFELATVISNLTENALYAASNAKDEKWVKIRIFTVKKQLMLEIRNTFAGKASLSVKNGLPVSERGEGHGYGLLSVRAFAEKNDAIFKYSAEGNIFCVQLITDL